MNKNNFEYKLLGKSSNVISIITGIGAIVSFLLEYYVVTFYCVSFVLVFFFISVYWRILYIPWHKDFRPFFLVFFHEKNSLKTYLRALFCKPYYEVDYLYINNESVPLDNVMMSNKFCEKITVIIEDDPVGFIEPSNMILSFAVNSSKDAEMLYENLRAQISIIKSLKVFFISTSSRMLGTEKSFSLNKEIGMAIKKLSELLREDIRVVSKIDSCLRSNYEAEYTGLYEGYFPFSLEVLAPSYIEQKRITINGTQYLYAENEVHPIHKSEFCSVKGLEFANSNLALWLERKVRDKRLSRHDVALIDLKKLYSLNQEVIIDKINRSKVKAVVFDSHKQEDLWRICDVCLLLENTYKKVFYKFGPSMINAIVQLYTKNKEVIPISNIKAADKCIVVAGSLSTQTKNQINQVSDDPKSSIVQIYESDLRQYSERISLIDRKTEKLLSELKKSDNVVLTTQFWREENNEYPTTEKRDIALSFFADILKRIKKEKNRYFLFKGSDTALHSMVKGFGITQFYYCGQFIPGVIHCKCFVKGENNLKSFFIIGGNVGDEELLLRLFEKIQNMKGNLLNTIYY